MIQNFSIKKYINAYNQQLSVLTNSSGNYNIYVNYDPVVALITNTIIYRDIPLDIIEQFETSINWDEERSGEEEYEHPFITHLNPINKTFVTSFLDNDLNRIDEAAYGIQFMKCIAEKYDYKYLIVVNKEIPKVLNSCKRLGIKPENIQIINEQTVNTILMMNSTLKENGVIMMNDDSDENKESNDEKVDDKVDDNNSSNNGNINSDANTTINTTPTNNTNSLHSSAVEAKIFIDSDDIPEHESINLSSTSSPSPSPVSTTSQTHPSITLRPYQKDYIQYMNDHCRTILKLPCGMGKSLIIIYHIMMHKQLSVVLVPNIALVDQFYNNIIKYYTAFNVELPEIHRLSTKFKEFTINEPSKQQIIVAVYNSFTNYFIRPLLKKDKPTQIGSPSDKPLTSSSVTEKQPRNYSPSSILTLTHFPYIYIDEAHHIILPSNKKQTLNINALLEEYDSEADPDKTSSSNPDFIETLHSLPRFSTAFSSLLFIFSQTYCEHSAFFSATISPSNKSDYNMFKAIQEGYLCKLNVDIVVDENYSRPQIVLESKILTLVDYLSKSPYKSIIIYTTRVETAKKIQAKLPFRSAVISASLASSVRQQYFKEFSEHNIRALLTVNCISEGVDLPCADTAIFFDDKKSIINIIQCVGRVMRNHEGKLSSTLVIPAYNDDDIDSIYNNMLSIINGELGYGSANIRRIVNVKFNTVTKHRRQEIKSKVFHKIYEYNESYFNEISLNSKLRLCTYFYMCRKIIPTLDLKRQDAKLPDGSYFDLQQFVHDNLMLNNEAGKRLRELYNVKV